MAYLFTSESVSEGHPDKVADQISDALLDAFLKKDSDSKVACETLVTTGLVVLSGEVNTNEYVDVQRIARDVIRNIGYNKSELMFDADSCGVISAIHEQSPDINQGVVRESEEEQGAGDQGIMFGYATNQTDNYMPIALEFAHLLLAELANIRHEGKEMKYLRPDSKSQVTFAFDDNRNPMFIDTIVISTQHDEFVMPTEQTPEARKKAENQMLDVIRQDIQKVLIPRVRKNLPSRLSGYLKDDYKLLVNPTGKFVIGGPHGDTGLTGRKIIVDTYGGRGAHGGGAFSGKDSSKVDRSAAYATRYIAKNMVAAGIADEILIQVAYAIGVAQPVGFYVNTYGTAKVNDASGNSMTDKDIADKVQQIFDLRPSAIIKKFGLKNPIFQATAAYGHMGRTPYKEMVSVFENGTEVQKEVEFFTWEKLDAVDQLKQAFGL